MINTNSSLTRSTALEDQPVRADAVWRRSGHGLERLLSSAPALTPLVIPSFLRVIAAVEEVHRGNAGPCNLDPREVFFRSDGTVELSAVTPRGPGMTLGLGSLKYSAPEAFEETTGQGDACLIDSYVLGIVFYEILLGKDLFDHQFQEVSIQGDFAWLAWHADKSKRAKPLAELIQGFPPVLSGLIDGMMSKEPCARITDLRKIASTIGAASQTTIAITNLVSRHMGDAPYIPQIVSFAQKVDASWQLLVGAMRDHLQRPRWNRFFAKRMTTPRCWRPLVSEFFTPRRAERARSVRANHLLNQGRGWET